MEPDGKASVQITPRGQEIGHGRHSNGRVEGEELDAVAIGFEPPAVAGFFFCWRKTNSGGGGRPTHGWFVCVCGGGALGSPPCIVCLPETIEWNITKWRRKTTVSTRHEINACFVVNYSC